MVVKAEEGPGRGKIYWDSPIKIWKSAGIYLAPIPGYIYQQCVQRNNQEDNGSQPLLFWYDEGNQELFYL